jgi:PIN domain nuclease of toxin-antitoxin system
MNLLLDTHTFLWFINADTQLPFKDVELISDLSNIRYVSIASIWEIVIKFSLNKLEIIGGFNTIENFLENNDIEVLPINFSHTKQLLTLPYHHNDPFDRIIISQAISENLHVITKDEFFKLYDVSVIW